MVFTVSNIFLKINITSPSHSFILIPLLVRMRMPIHGPQPRTWQVSGTCCSSPLRTSASSLMSSTISSPMTGSLFYLQLPTHPLSGRYFPPLLPSALAGVGKPPKPASLLPPPPPPFLPLFFTSPSTSPRPCVGWTLTGPPCPTQRVQRDPFRHAWTNSPQRGLLVCFVCKALIWACMCHLLMCVLQWSMAKMHWLIWQCSLAFAFAIALF